MSGLLWPVKPIKRILPAFLASRTTSIAPPLAKMRSGSKSRITSWNWSKSTRSEEHTSELQSPCNLVCRLLLEKKKQKQSNETTALQCRVLLLDIVSLAADSPRTDLRALVARGSGHLSSVRLFVSFVF